MKMSRIIFPCILLILIEQGSVMADNDHNDDLSTSEPITNGIHRGSVSNVDSDCYIFIVPQFTSILIELDSPENDTIQYRLFDMDMDSLHPFKDAFIVNNQTKTEALSTYWPNETGVWTTLPGLIFENGGEMEDRVYFEITGNGTYEFSIYTRELNERERGEIIEYSKTDYEFAPLLLGIEVLILIVIIGSIVGIIFLIRYLMGSNDNENG